MLKSSKNNIANFSNLHYVRLRKVMSEVDYGSIRAIFSSLNPNEPEDIEAILKLQKKFSEKSKILNLFCNDFCDNSENKQQYNCISLFGNKHLSERIVGLVSYCLKDDGNLELSLIVATPDFSFVNKTRQIKNVGETLLVEIFKKAKKMRADHITFTTAYPALYFYHKTFKNAGVNMIKDENSTNKANSDYFVNNKDFDKYINYYKNKYSDDFYDGDDDVKTGT